MLTCKSMRFAVVLSAFLLVLGTLLGVIAPPLGLGVGGGHLALLTVLTATGMILVAFILALLPRSVSHMKECQH